MSDSGTVCRVSSLNMTPFCTVTIFTLFNSQAGVEVSFGFGVEMTFCYVCVTEVMITEPFFKLAPRCLHSQQTPLASETR